MTTRATILTCVLLLGAAGVQWASRPEAAIVRRSFSTFPATVGPWQATADTPLDPKVLDILRVDDYLNRVYAGPLGAQLSFYIGYFKSQRVGQTIHSPLVCLPGNGWQPIKTSRLPIDVTLGGPGKAHPATIDVNRLVIQDANQQRELVLYWYQSGERVVAGDYLAKMYKFIDAIRHNRTDGALVRVIVPFADDRGGEAAAERRAVQFVKESFPLLADYLPR